MMPGAQFIDNTGPDLGQMEPSQDLIRPQKQRSPEWYEQRRGRFTGSEVWKLTVEPRDATAKKLGLFGETAMTYIRERLSELITGVPKDVWSPAIQWGLDHEDEAKGVYSDLTGNTLTDDCFAPLEDFGGGSVDSFINADGLLEIKCPNSDTHLENLLLAAKKPNEAYLKAEKRELYWQVQNNMLCTGRKWAHFVSYDPRFPKDKQIAVIRVNYVLEDADLLLTKLRKAKQVMDEMKEELSMMTSTL